MGTRRRSTEFKNSSQIIDMDEARQQRAEKRQAEKEKEEAKQAAVAARKTRGKMAMRRSRNRRRLLVGIVIAVLIALTATAVVNIVSLKKEQADVQAEKKQLEEQKAWLEQDLEGVDDLDNIEQQARDQLRLIKPGETLYIFPDSINDKTEENKEDETD